IRDRNVTGVQTCALPILTAAAAIGPEAQAGVRRGVETGMVQREGNVPSGAGEAGRVDAGMNGGSIGQVARTPTPVLETVDEVVRSEERRVGNECRCQGVE